MFKLKCRWVDSEGGTREGLLISIQPSDHADHYVGIVILKGAFKAWQVPIGQLDILVK